MEQKSIQSKPSKTPNKDVRIYQKHASYTKVGIFALYQEKTLQKPQILVYWKSWNRRLNYQGNMVMVSLLASSDDQNFKKMMAIDGDGGA